MRDRSEKLDEKEKILFVDTNNFYGWAISQSLRYDEIELWHGHPDLYMNKLEEILNTADDSDGGFFLEVDLIYPDKINKKKRRNLHFVLKMKLFLKIYIMII